MTPSLYFRFRGKDLPPLTKQRGTLGRGDFDVPIEDATVSRQGHAEIFFRGGCFWVRPLQEGREVRVDHGAALQLEDEVVLQGSGVLTLGGARIEFRSSVDTDVGTPVADSGAPAQEAVPSDSAAVAPPIQAAPASLRRTTPARLEIAPGPKPSENNASEIPPLSTSGEQTERTWPFVAVQVAACLGLLALASALGLWIGSGLVP